MIPQIRKLIALYRYSKQVKRYKKYREVNRKKKLEDIKYILTAKNHWQFNSQSISNLVCALRNLGFCKRDLPPEILKELLKVVCSKVDGFNPQGVALTLLALRPFNSELEISD